jgi:GT2 family glycosyltransferase
MQPLDIHVGIVSYNLVKELHALIASCVSFSGHRVTVHLFDHSPHPQVNAIGRIAAAGGIIGRDGNPVRVKLYHHGYNRGLCPGWNDGMLACYGEDPAGWSDGSNRVCILVNDDIEFDAAPEPTQQSDFFNDDDGTVRLGWKWDGKSDIDRLAEYAHANRHLFMVTVLGFNKHYVDNPSPHPQKDGLAGPWIGIGFSCFAVNPIALRTVGMCDENIVPIYFEDCDWGHRAIASGLQMGELKQTRIVHYGSLSWKVDPALHEQNTNRATPAIRDYYCRKWGCLPGQGTPYSNPFNNKRISLYIAPEDRHEPYGPMYDRSDIASVITI